MRRPSGDQAHQEEAAAVARRPEHQPLAVRREGRLLVVVGRVGGEVDRAAAVGAHDVEVEVARRGARVDDLAPVRREVGLPLEAGQLGEAAQRELARGAGRRRREAGREPARGGAECEQQERPGQEAAQRRRGRGRAHRSLARSAWRQRLLERDPRVGDVVQAVSRIALQAAAQQPADRGRRVIRQGAEIDLGLEHPGQHVARRRAGEELAPGQHLEQHDTEAPDIGPLVDGFTPRLLGRHVGRGAEDQAGRGAGVGHGG